MDLRNDDDNKCTVREKDLPYLIPLIRPSITLYILSSSYLIASYLILYCIHSFASTSFFLHPNYPSSHLLQCYDLFFLLLFFSYLLFSFPIFSFLFLSFVFFSIHFLTLLFSSVHLLAFSLLNFLFNQIHLLSLHFSVLVIKMSVIS